jgi:glycosyltransferase involved in cell wall biosynthesis
MDAASLRTGTRAGTEATPPPAALSLVIPVRNEAPVILRNLAQIRAVAERAGGGTALLEIVCVDDGSSDGSGEILARLAAEDSRFSVVGFTRNFGKEAAIAAGLQRARGEAVIVMDSDLQHPPELIPEMVRLWRGGSLVVEAYKEHRGPEPWHSKVLAQGFYALFYLASGQDLRNHCDYKLLDRQVVQAYLGLSERRRFFRGLVHWMGFPSAQVRFKVPPRPGGTSAWSAFKLFRLSIDALTSFSSVPLQIITWVGIGTFAVSAALGVAALYQKLTGGAVDGFTTVILLLLLVSSALMVSLGVLGVYVGKIYDELKGRPLYMLSEHRRDTPPGGSDHAREAQAGEARKGSDNR